SYYVCLLRVRATPHTTLFPYTTLFRSWEYDVVAPGYKYNMPDVNAAIGLAQLEQAETFREGRMDVAQYYYDHLAECDWMDLPVLDRKSTRLNSSHVKISYAVFCLKKKN